MLVVANQVLGRTGPHDGSLLKEVPAATPMRRAEQSWELSDASHFLCPRGEADSSSGLSIVDPCCECVVGAVRRSADHRLPSKQAGLPSQPWSEVRFWRSGMARELRCAVPMAAVTCCHRRMLVREICQRSPTLIHSDFGDEVGQNVQGGRFVGMTSKG